MHNIFVTNLGQVVENTTFHSISFLYPWAVGHKQVAIVFYSDTLHIKWFTLLLLLYSREIVPLSRRPIINVILHYIKFPKFTQLGNCQTNVFWQVRRVQWKIKREKIQKDKLWLVTHFIKVKKMKFWKYWSLYIISQ